MNMDEQRGLPVIRRSDEVPVSHANRWGMRVTISLLVVTGVMVGVWAILILLPYDQVRVAQPGPVQSTEETSSGLPVLRTGGPIRYEADFCNQGVDLLVTRWMDIYGTYRNDDGDVLFEAGGAQRSAAFELPTVEFFNETPTCGSTDVTVAIPNYVPEGFVYVFRTEVAYQANPLKWVRYTTETEPFLLLTPDAPIP
jgi:hypothetical protein